MPSPTVATYALRWFGATVHLFRRTTRRGYRCMLEKHILGPAQLGNIRLCDVTRTLIRQRLVDCLRDGLSINMVRSILTALSSLLASAVEEGLLEHNPAHGAGRRLLPRQRGAPRAPKEDTFGRLLAAAGTIAPWLERFMLVVARTGLRLAEGLGQQVDDLDLHAGYAVVYRQFHGAGRVGPTKSNRVTIVRLSPDACTAIATQLRDLPASPEGWLWLPKPRRRWPYHPNYVTELFHEACTRAELPHHTGHAFRHACATWLLNRGADMIDVQDQLRHASIDQTVDLYGRGRTPRAVADLLDRPPPVHRPPLRAVRSIRRRRTG